MSLSRRGLLMALGLALPAATLLSEEAEAAPRPRGRKAAAQETPAKKAPVANAATRTAKQQRAQAANTQPASRRRRRSRTAA